MRHSNAKCALCRAAGFAMREKNFSKRKETKKDWSTDKNTKKRSRFVQNNRIL